MYSGVPLLSNCIFPSRLIPVWLTRYVDFWNKSMSLVAGKPNMHILRCNQKNKRQCSQVFRYYQTDYFQVDWFQLDWSVTLIFGVRSMSVIAVKSNMHILQSNQKNKCQCIQVFRYYQTEYFHVDWFQFDWLVTLIFGVSQCLSSTRNRKCILPESKEWVVMYSGVLLLPNWAVPSRIISLSYLK